MARLRRRFSRVRYFRRHGFLRGVEVGVFEGQFLELLCKPLPAATLYGVDPWRDNDGVPMVIQLRRTLKRTAPFGDRCRLIVCSSPQAAEIFAAGMLDFAFIDGDHSYEAVFAGW